jgi:hypothetical protein
MTSDGPSAGPAPEPKPAPSKRRRTPSGDLVDPAANAVWSIVSYVLSGIVFWGVIGWLLDRWLLDSATSGRVIFLPIGVVLGAVAGGYLGYMRFLHIS